MNKIFRVIWSQAQQAWVVVSELTKSHGKGHSVVSEQAVENEAKNATKGFVLTGVALGVLLVTDPAFAVTYTGSAANDLNFRDHRTTIILGNGASTYTTALPQEGGRNINPDAVIIGANAGNSNLNGNGAKVTVVGANAKAGDSSVAVGWSSSAATTFGVAVGYEAVSAAGSGAAFGRNSRAGAESVALGPNATASTFGVGVGLASKSYANGGVAIGRNAQVGAEAGMGEADTRGIYGVAIGQNANVTSSSSVAIGLDAKAKGGDFASALGYNSNASGKSSFALGYNATSVGERSVAMIFNSYAEKESDVAIGYASKATGGTSLAMMANSTASAVKALAIGDNATASAGQAISIGALSKARSADTISIGHNATTGTSAAKSIAIGIDANVTGSQSIAIGVGNKVSGNNAGAFGDPNTVSGNNSYAFGNDNTVSADNTFVMGNNINTAVANSVVLGNNAATVASGTSTKAMDAYASDTVAGQTLNFAGGTPTGLVSVGSATETRRIQGVSAGLISADSTDAINGSQLYAVANGLKTYIDSRPAGTGTGTAPNNYFHVNPSATATAAAGTNNEAPVDGIGGATGGHALAAGFNAKAGGDLSVAIGKDAATDTSGAIAIGDRATAVVSGTTLANGSKATGGIAIGTGTRSNHQDTIAMGTEASSTNLNATAIGTKASATVEDTTAIGAGSQASGPRSIALSKEAKATGGESIALGYQAEAKSFGTALGSKSKTEDNYALAVGYESQAIGQQSTAVGYKANTTKEAISGIAVGQEASAREDHAMAMGYQAVASGERATAIGDTARASAVDAIAQGSSAQAIATNAIATGKSAIASEENAMAQGTGAKAFKADAIAQGTNAQAVGDSAVAIGKDSYVGSATHTPQQIQDITDAYNNALSEQTTLNTRREEIINQIDELIAERSALNRQRPRPEAQIAAIVAQIGALDTELEEINTKVDAADEAVKTTKVAFDAVQGAGVRGIAIGDTAKVHAKDGLALGAGAIVADGLENAVALGANSVVTAVTAAPDADIKGITYGDFAGNNPSAGDVVSVGSEGKERRIQNVAAGRITADSTDAINGSQLYIVAERLNRQNYFHVNPNENPVAASGTNNEDAVDGIGNATGGKALAAGFDATASGKASIAIGDKANADNLGGIAIGQGAVSATVGKNASVEAAQTQSGVNKAIAIGNAAQATNSKTVAIGDAAAASGLNAVAIGSQTQSTGAESTVVGSAAQSHGDFSVSIGQRANVTSTGFAATAIGNLALASGREATALGRSAKAEGDQATAIGLNSTAAGQSGIAMGTRANASAVHSVAISTEALATANQAIAIGRSAKSEGGSSVAIGDSAEVAKDKTNSVAIGWDATVTGSSAVALGRQANATFDNAVSIGSNANALNASATAIGQRANATHGNAIAMGVDSKAFNANTVAIGRDAHASLDGSVALGYGATTTAATRTQSATVNDISYGNFAGANANTNYVVSVGNAGAERQIQNVAAGRISNTSTDAINGSQLYAVMTTGSWQLQHEGAEVGDVNWGDKVNFTSADKSVTITPTTEKDGVSVLDFKVNVDNKTVKVDPATGDVTAITTELPDANTDGKIDAPTNGDALVNATTVANAINNSGFTAKAAATADGKDNTVAPVKDTGTVVNPGETVTFEADKNLEVTQTVETNGDTKFSFKTKDDVTFNKVTSNTIEVPTDVADKPITINNNGIDMADKPITNINNNLTNAPNGLRDLTNNTVDDKTAATVGDLRNMGWVVSSNKTTGAATGQPTDTAFTNNVKNANEVQFVGTGIAKVSGDVKDGKNVITVHVDETPAPQTSNITADATSGQIGVKNGDTVNTNPTENPNNLVTANDVVNAVNNAFWKVGEGEGATATKKDDVKAGDTVNFANGTGTVANVTTDGTTTTVKYSVKTDNTTIKVDDAGNITANTGDLTNTDGKVDTPTGDEANKLTTAGDVANAINESGFKLTATKSTGDVEGASEELINPSDTVTIDAGDNIKLTQDKGKITVATKQDVTFNNVTSNTVKVPTDVADKPITINNNGIDMADKPIANVAGNLDGAKKDTTAPTTVSTSTPAGDTLNNAATVGDVLNAGWNLKHSDGTTTTDKDFVRHADNVVFANGVATTASVETTDGGKTSTIKFDVKTDGTTIKVDPTSGNITANTANLGNNATDGKVTVPTGDENKLTTANDVAEAINNSGFRVKSAGTNKADGDDATERLVKTGELVEFEAGDNLTVKRVGDKFTYATAKEVKFDKVTVGGDTNPITITSTPSTTGGNPTNTISNLTGNLAPTTSNADGSVINKDGTDGKTADNKPTTAQTAPTATEAKAINNNAATVGDVLNAGWNLQGNGEAKDFVKPYDTVNFVDGKGTKAVVESDGTTSTIKVDVDNGVITANNNGSVTGPVSTQLQDDLKKAQDELAALPDTATEEEKKAAQDKVDAAQDAVDNAGNQVATAQNVADAINKSGFNLKTSATADGKKEDGTANDGELINPSDTVEMIAGKNLTVKQDANGKVTYATKDDVEFNSVTSNTIKVPTNVDNPAVNPITINKDGMDMANKPITNVASNLPDVNSRNVPATNVDKPTSVNNSNAATVGDVLNAGWNLKVTGNSAVNPTDVDFVSPYDAVNFKAGTGVLLGHESDGKTSTITISLAGDNGALRVSDGSTLTENPLGRVEVVENPTGMVNAGNVANMINKSGFSTTATLVMPNGDRFDGVETLINPGDQVNYVDGSNTKANVTVEKTAVPVTTFWVTETVNGKDQRVQVEPTKVDENGNITEAVYASGSSKAGQAVDLANTKIDREINRVEQDKFNVSYDVVTGETEVPATGDNKGKAAVTGAEPANTALQAAKDALEVAKAGNDQAAIDAAQAKVDEAQKAVDNVNNTVATVGDIVETINNVAWFTNSTTAVSVAVDTAIKAGGRVNLEAGKNIEVTQTVDPATNTVSYTYSTKEEVDFNKVTLSNGDTYATEDGDKLTKVGDKFYKDDQLENGAPKADAVAYDGKVVTTQPANTVNLVNEAGTKVTNAGTGQDASKPAPSALNITGTDAAGNASPTQITGVASTLNTKPVETSPAGTGSQGSDNLVDLKGDANNPVNPTSAATVGDLQNMGWVVSASGNEYKDTVKNANQVNFVGTGLATVTGKTDDQGVRTITVDVNAQSTVETAQTPVVYTNKDGDKVYKQPDGTFNTKPDGKGNVVQPADVIASMNNGGNSTTAPMTLANIASNLAPTTSNADGDLINKDGTDGKTEDSKPTTSQTAPTNAKDINNNAATVGDVLNAGWNLQGNGEAKDFVKPYDTVNFVDGKGTKAVVESNGEVSTIKVDIDNGVITANENGSVTGPVTDAQKALDDAKKALADNTDIDPDVVKNLQDAVTKAEQDLANAPNQVATAQNVADAINKSGFNLKTSATAEGAKEAGTADDGELINPSDTVEMVAGKNLTVKQDANGKVTYATKEEVDFNKVTVSNGDNLVDGKGNKVTAEKDPVTGDTVYKNAAGDIINANEVKPANTVNLVNEAGTKVTNAGTGQDANKPAPSALNITGTDAAGNASPTQITGVASTLNTKAVDTAPTGKGSQGSDNLVDLKGDANNPVNPTSAATVGDLQNMGWVVSASGNEYKDTVKNANQVNFVGTGLATVTGKTDDQGVRTITVDVNAQSTVENAQLPVVYTNAQGDKVYKQVDAQGNVTFNTKPDGKGDVVQPADVIASMNNGSNSTTAPMTLANIASNLADVTPVNEKQPDANSIANLEGKKNNAATVADVLNAGWNLQNNDTAIDTVTHNDTVNFVDGRGTTVSVTPNEDGTANDIKVDVETDDKTITVKDGNLAAVTTTLAEANNDGKIDAPVNGDSLVNATTVANAINSSGFIATASGNTVGTTKEQLIKTGEKVTLDAGKNLTVTQTDGKFSFATKDDVNFNSVQFGDIGPKITHDGNNIKVGDKDGKATKITNVDNGTSDNDAVNFSQLKASQEVVKSDDKSITVTTTKNAAGANVFDVSVNVDGTTITKDPATGAIKANTADLNVTNDGNIAAPTTGDENKLITAGEVAQTVNNVSWKVDSAKDETTANAATKNTYTAGNNKVKAGDTVKVNAGRNVEISGSGKEINVAVSDNPEFNTVKVGKGDNATTISSNAEGLKVAKADGSPQRITNVANGVADNDAVNVSQLKGVANQLNNKINRNNREARAGIAGSNAAASLPQVYIPGKSMVAASAGTFKGENALAVGYSRASDNGKLILKLQGNANSRGDVGAGVGIGYQW